jgi:hypothetical protein
MMQPKDTEATWRFLYFSRGKKPMIVELRQSSVRGIKLTGERKRGFAGVVVDFQGKTDRIHFGPFYLPKTQRSTSTTR